MSSQEGKEGGCNVLEEADASEYRGGFTLRLCTIGPERDHPNVMRLGSPAPISAGESAEQPALGALIDSLATDQTLRITHRITATRGQTPRYELDVHGIGRGPDGRRALAVSQALLASTSLSLGVAAPSLGFQLVTAPASIARAVHPYRLSLHPVAVALPSASVNSIGFSSRGATRTKLLLPLPPLVARQSLHATVTSMLVLGDDVELSLEVSRRSISESQVDLVVAMHGRLLEAGARRIDLVGLGSPCGRLDLKSAIALHANVQGWLMRPFGAEMQVCLSSSQPIPPSFAQAVGSEIFQGRPFVFGNPSFNESREECIDFSSTIGIAGALPPLLPASRVLLREGFPRHYPRARVATPALGIRLGRSGVAADSPEVRLAPADRSQHCYVIGATGTGKSTLLLNMILQDIASGEGVGVLDPHGDLFNDVLSRLPESRAGDLVVLDFTRPDVFVGINMLECQGESPDFERNVIIRDLARILERLYGHVPESMGPAFHQYMRNAVALLFSDPSREATLVEVPRVFSDVDYRNYLIASCADATVRDFWRGIAGRVTGDHSIANMGPYITNKFTEFTQNELIRLVVGQSKSTVDFTDVLDHRKVLLVNVSKGVLGSSDTSFLGMILTSRLVSAAMARARRARQHRVPFHLYVDEFHHFASSPFEAALAEGRKFGLTMTLAHQHLGQLSDEQRKSVLANSASRVFMRVGPQDATMLKAFVAPDFDETDLVSLPDLHGLAQLKCGVASTSPFVLHVDDFPKGVARDEVAVENLSSRACLRNVRSSRDVRREIELRRYRYLMRLTPRAAGFDGPLLDHLNGSGMTTLGDLLPMSAGQRSHYLKLASESSSRAASETMLQILKKLTDLQALEEQVV